MKTRTGFRVGPVTNGRLWITFGVGPFKVAEPAIVVASLRTDTRAALVYGTITGHPISGEEAFLVRRDSDGTVWFTLRSLSRRAPGAWAPAYPLVLLIQRYFRRRYLRALRLPA